MSKGAIIWSGYLGILMLVLVTLVPEFNIYNFSFSEMSCLYKLFTYIRKREAEQLILEEIQEILF